MKNKLEGVTLLKLLAAVQVLYLHLVVHYNLDQLNVNGVDVVGRALSPFQGVPIFFAISGYFIWKSLSKRKTLAREYAYRRFVRIYPELWITVALSVILIIALYRSNISVVPFIAWIFTQSTVMQFWTPSCLRGYGVGCPNGALWTVTVFVQFYILIFVFHRILHKGGKFKWGGVLLAAAIANILPGMLESHIPPIVYKLYQQTVFPYLSIFMIAAFIAEYEEMFKRLLNCRWLCVVLYMILAVGLPIDFFGAGYAIIRSALVVIFAITFGNTVKCGIFKEDISYEIYLVHMPIANVFVQLMAKQTWATFFISVVLTVIVAYALYSVNDKVIRKLGRKTLLINSAGEN